MSRGFNLLRIETAKLIVDVKEEASVAGREGRFNLHILKSLLVLVLRPLLIVGLPESLLRVLLARILFELL